MSIEKALEIIEQEKRSLENIGLCDGYKIVNYAIVVLEEIEKELTDGKGE